MAVGQIDIDVQVVRSVSKDLNKDVTEIEEMITELKNIEEDIRDAWKSVYTEDYIECITETRKRLEKIKNSIGNISTSLDNTAKEVERTERDLNNIFTSFNGSGGSHSF